MIASTLVWIAAATGSPGGRQWGPGHGWGGGPGDGWHHGFGLGGVGWGSALALAVALAALALAIWALLRTRRPAAGVVTGGGGSAAMETLQLRLARGEIAPEDYSRSVSVLSGEAGSAPTAEMTPPAEETPPASES